MHETLWPEIFSLCRTWLTWPFPDCSLRLRAYFCFQFFHLCVCSILIFALELVGRHLEKPLVQFCISFACTSSLSLSLWQRRMLVYYPMFQTIWERLSECSRGFFSFHHGSKDKLLGKCGPLDSKICAKSLVHRDVVRVKNARDTPLVYTT